MEQDRALDRNLRFVKGACQISGLVIEECDKQRRGTEQTTGRQLFKPETLERYGVKTKNGKGEER